MRVEAGKRRKGWGGIVVVETEGHGNWEGESVERRTK